jgi:hypothetical protein
LINAFPSTQYTVYSSLDPPSGIDDSSSHSFARFSPKKAIEMTAPSPITLLITKVIDPSLTAVTMIRSGPNTETSTPSDAATVA